MRYIGCSNFAAWHIEKSVRVSERDGLARFDCLQPQYSLGVRDIEREILPIPDVPVKGTSAIDARDAPFQPITPLRPSSIIVGLNSRLRTTDGMPESRAVSKSTWPESGSVKDLIALNLTMDLGDVCCPKVTIR